MKGIRLILGILFCIGTLFNGTSCVVLKKDNGNHKGWFKNSNNPHNSSSTKKTPSSKENKGNSSNKKKK